MMGHLLACKTGGGGSVGCQKITSFHYFLNVLDVGETFDPSLSLSWVWPCCTHQQKFTATLESLRVSFSVELCESLKVHINNCECYNLVILSSIKTKVP